MASAPLWYLAGSCLVKGIIQRKRQIVWIKIVFVCFGEFLRLFSRPFSKLRLKRNSQGNDETGDGRQQHPYEEMLIADMFL